MSNNHTQQQQCGRWEAVRRPSFPNPDCSVLAGALLAAEHVKGSVKVSVEEGKDTRLHVSE